MPVSTASELDEGWNDEFSCGSAFWKLFEKETPPGVEVDTARDERLCATTRFEWLPA
jgi:hypothetical protein